MAAELIEFYDEYSGTYRELLEEVRYQVPAFLSRRASLLPRGALILDLGCADGLVGDTLAAAVAPGASGWSGSTCRPGWWSGAAAAPPMPLSTAPTSASGCRRRWCGTDPSTR
eukprot:TRINITY_DN12170_c0_g1_i1.p1 TRINITY_DN12170_c0_g1~~TRINITY_DN12170_c0_g1_i1.p1  ORF type:complete len:120 (-),score=15.62 TRINITY_DN12170_c0_g1_i1:48-386(-)